MKATMNLMDLWIEWQMRCWYTVMLSSVPILRALMPDPQEPQGLRNYLNVQRDRIDNIEKRMRNYGI